MSHFSESSYEYDEDDDTDFSAPQIKANKKNSIFRDIISSILFTCSGETTQYEETLSALEDSLVCYLHHLTQESLKCAKNPQKISSDDIVSALKEYPQAQNNIISFIEDMKSFTKEMKNL